METPDPLIVAKINSMSQYAMASAWRFHALGSIYFDSTKPYHEIFAKRFKELGGMTPEISKSLGW